MAGTNINHSSEDTVPLIACHECDAVYRRETLPPRATASCRRCGAFLYRHSSNSLDRSLALHLTALILLIIANTFPFLSVRAIGRTEENLLLTASLALYDAGMGELGLVVFLTSIAFPFMTLLGMLYLLIAVRLGLVPPGIGRVYRLVRALAPWSLVGVFMLGTLIAIVKLQDLATVIPGPALFAFTALLIVYTAARVNFDPEVLWTTSAAPGRYPDALSADARPLSCHTCGLFSTDDVAGAACRRCGTTLHRRLSNSINRTWALLVSAVVMLIPANLLPVMTVKQFGAGQPDTIMSGVIHLIEGGMWGLALIVFFASVVVPAVKILTLAFLLHSVQQGSAWRPRDRTLLYRATEIVGAWSMVDVFLVGLLSGLVSLGVLADIEPGIGATFFAAAVILTMFAAHSFDPRLIWDRAQDDAAAISGPPPASQETPIDAV